MRVAVTLCVHTSWWWCCTSGAVFVCEQKYCVCVCMNVRGRSCGSVCKWWCSCTSGAEQILLCEQKYCAYGTGTVCMCMCKHVRGDSGCNAVCSGGASYDLCCVCVNTSIVHCVVLVLCVRVYACEKC